MLPENDKFTQKNFVLFTEKQKNLLHSNASIKNSVLLGHGTALLCESADLWPVARQLEDSFC